VVDFVSNKDIHDFLFIHWKAYYNPMTHFIKVEKYYNWLLVTLNVILLPVLIIFHGLPNVISDMYRLFRQQKTGSFISHKWKLNEDDRKKVRLK